MEKSRKIKRAMSCLCATGLILSISQSTIIAGDVYNAYSDKPAGFASAAGGTTGGAGGKEVAITSAQQLVDLMSAREKGDSSALICKISSVITGASRSISVKRTGNITFIGDPGKAKFQGFGINMVECHNIIIRYIMFEDCSAGEKDGLTVDRTSHVWIDHCSFSDGSAVDEGGKSHDGSLDVKKGSEYVTLSNNYFTNHRKTCLLGHSPSETGDVAMKVTYMYNWFNGTFSRHPRARYGMAHILNNLYTSVGKPYADKPNEYGYGIGVTCAAQILAEGNYFENTKNPILISTINDSLELLSGDPAGYVKSVDNYLSSSGAITENTSGFNFDPKTYYSYTAMSGQSVKEYVMNNAGPIKQTSIQGSINESSLNPVRVVSNSRDEGAAISFSLFNKAHVSVSLYNMSGAKVASVVDKVYGAGDHVIALGKMVSPGSYICKSIIGKEVYNIKLVIDK